MPKTSQKNPADYITPLYINGLQGRMLHMPSPSLDKKREILFVYGHHASLERYWGIMEDLNDYGAVTMPDLPGFGGMDSFYKLSQEPTLDNFADYLATFVKLRYRRKRLTIVGFSLGFVIATRMLQRYPDLAKKVDLLISAVGFTHHDDFNFTRRRTKAYHLASKIISHQVPAILFRYVCLNSFVLRLAYSRTNNAKEKFANVSRAEHRAIMDFEIHLWHCNEVRTWATTSAMFFSLDNCQKRVNLPVWHISVDADRYFDNHRVEQHMRVIFADFHAAKSKINNHAPSVILTKADARHMIPPKIRQLLSERV